MQGITAVARLEHLMRSSGRNVCVVVIDVPNRVLKRMDFYIASGSGARK
jgi:hypothetical protein